MVEVGLLGILVAVIKLAGFVQVVPGPGIWAMAGLMVFLALIANRDIHWLWELAERAPASQAVRA
jgi:paraquat-inducible protein A